MISPVTCQRCGTTIRSEWNIGAMCRNVAACQRRKDAASRKDIVRDPTIFEGHVALSIRRWINKHPGVVESVCNENGAASKTTCETYNVVLAPGYRLGSAYGHLSWMRETTAKAVLARLNTVQEHGQ